MSCGPAALPEAAASGLPLACIPRLHAMSHLPASSPRSRRSPAYTPAKPRESVGGGEGVGCSSSMAPSAATAAAPGGEAATTLSRASRVARMRRAVSVVALLPPAWEASANSGEQSSSFNSPS